MQLKSSRGVQLHEVEAAADALLAEGLRPTVERVRAKIGRGSPNTVAPMLETWFAGLAPRLGVSAAEQGKPGGIPAAVRQGTQQLWEAALQLARGEAQAALSSEYEALARDKDSLAASRIEAAGQLAVAKQHAEAMQVAIDQARADVESSMGRMRQAQCLLELRDRELTEARASIVQLVAHKDAAAKDHADHLKRLDGERAKIQQRAAATERRLLEEVDRARQESKAAHKKIVQLETDTARLHTELAQAREAMGATIHELQVERAKLLERLAGSGQRGGHSTPVAAHKVVKKTGRRPAGRSAAAGR